MADDSFGWLTPGAKRHILEFLRVAEPAAGDLDRALAVRLRSRGLGESQAAALRRITPWAAANYPKVEPFLRSTARAGGLLAAAGLRPEDAAAALDECEALLSRRFPGRFQPAREQLRSAVLFTLYRAFYELREREVRRLEALARRAEEQERRRIGRELHDEAGQSLLLLRLQLEMLERQAPETLRLGLRETQAAAAGIIRELRRIVAALSPAVLEKLGLTAAIRHLAARFRHASPAAVRVRIAGGLDGLPMELQELVYRAAQEGLQNIAKHARATRVNLSLEAADMSIRLRLGDNGAGFNTETAGKQAMSFGLAGMRQRAELLGGTLTVRSAPGKGTVLMLEAPAPVGMGWNAKNSNTDCGRPHAVPAGHAQPALRRARYGSSRRGAQCGGGRGAGIAGAAGRHPDGHRDAGIEQLRGGAPDPEGASGNPDHLPLDV
jgi:two-component system sensor histidine kinase UhpB